MEKLLIDDANTFTYTVKCWRKLYRPRIPPMQLAPYNLHPVAPTQNSTFFSPLNQM